MVLDAPRFTSCYAPMVHVHAASIACRFAKLHCIINKKNGEIVEKNPLTLRAGVAALVTLVPLSCVTLESYFKFAALGRFVIRDGARTIAIGSVKSVRRITDAGELILSGGKDDGKVLPSALQAPALSQLVDLDVLKQAAKQLEDKKQKKLSKGKKQSTVVE